MNEKLLCRPFVLTFGEAKAESLYDHVSSMRFLHQCAGYTNLLGAFRNGSDPDPTSLRVVYSRVRFRW